MGPLISVIVPVYNVEDYLSKCVASILAQSYKNLQVILVDDGSTDRCPEICDDIAKRESRVQTIHKKNGGLSSARNAGIDAANGDFLAFVDSDDYIAPDMYEYLYRNMAETESDISICGKYVVYENGRLILKQDQSILCLVMDSEEAIRRMCSFRDYDTSSCDKLYKRELFSSIRFPLGKLCEDWYTTYRLLAVADKIVYGSKPLYYYYQRENSISRTKTIHEASIEGSRQMLEFVTQRFPAIINEAATAYAFENIGTYNSYIKYHQKCSSELRKRIKHNVRINIKCILRNKSIRIFKKVQALIFCVSQTLYANIFYLLKEN